MNTSSRQPSAVEKAALYCVDNLMNKPTLANNILQEMESVFTIYGKDSEVSTLFARLICSVKVAVQEIDRQRIAYKTEASVLDGQLKDQQERLSAIELLKNVQLVEPDVLPDDGVQEQPNPKTQEEYVELLKAGWVLEPNEEWRGECYKDGLFYMINQSREFLHPYVLPNFIWGGDSTKNRTWTPPCD